MARRGYPPPKVTEPLALFGHDLFGAIVKPPKAGPLAERFEFPPFSVLNAREGEWQERKRAWVGLGIRSEVGRGEGVTWGDSVEITEAGLNHYRNKKKAEAGGNGAPPLPAAAGGGAATAVSQKLAPGGGGGGAWLGGPATASSAKYGVTFGTEGNASSQSGTSIFDPVLTELCYRWFVPPGGQVVDPFAGGSVRGIVAGLLGLRYHGIDLSARQILANEVQRAELAPGADITWACGDSAALLHAAPPADFIFSCPPYGDLERYSDDPADLSTMEYPAFLCAYRAVIHAAAARLRPDRFACFVVGDFRCRRTGVYRGFVADTVNAFRDAGLALYNDAVLITAVGSLPVRVSGQFDKGRKLGKTHQNVLVFVKGEPRKAAAACVAEGGTIEQGAA